MAEKENNGMEISGTWEEVLGLVWDEVTPDRVIAHLDIAKRHHQPYGIVHSGAWASIVESVASHGAAHAVMTRHRSWNRWRVTAQPMPSWAKKGSRASSVRRT